MKTRIITAIAALLVFAIVLLAPPIVFTLALGAVTLFMLYECYKATNADGMMNIIGFLSAVIMMASVYVSRTWGSVYYIAAFAVVFTIIIHMVLVVIKHGKKSYKDILANGFLTLYIVFAMSCIWLLKEMLGIPFMLLVFICAWSTDTFAYFTGRICGKHKLIPHVSPNKTVEGAVGGVIGATIVSVVYLFACDKLLPISINWIVDGVAIGLVGGVLSQLGDLTASAIKRDTGIKDFGWIFPGHGGFMDRFDSVIFIAPILSAILVLTV